MDNSTIVKLAPASFPECLREIPDPPKALYRRGFLPAFGEYTYLCVVGSRKYSNYGKEVLENLLAGLRGLPIVIVSGLALGIDALAHQAALKHQLPTVAMPGSGLADKAIYPRSNFNLAQKILASGGALLSEYEPNFQATTWSFPERNRLMVGLSQAVLIIEATPKSGTLITARLATEYNRDVLTVPGSIFSLNSQGPNQLIRLGATPITKPAELRMALGFTENQTPDKNRFADCTTAEREIITILQTPRSREEILRLLTWPVSEINQTIALLELKNLIQEIGGEWQLKL